MTSSQIATTSSTIGFSAAMKGLGATLLSIAPYVAIVGAIAASAYIIYKQAKAFEDAVDSVKDAQSAYSESSSQLQSLNTELDNTKARVNELNSMDSLSITDQAELNRLQLQTKELERQIQLQKRLNEDNKQAMLSETMDTLNMQKTRDLSGNAETYRNVQGTQVKVKNGKTDIVTATRNEIEDLQKLKDKRNNMLVDDVSDIIQEKEFEDIDKQIQKYDNAISEQIETLNTLKASFEDANGVVLDGLTADQKAMYDSINSIIDNYLNLDLTESERNINKIQSFFDGTKSKNILKDQ